MADQGCKEGGLRLGQGGAAQSWDTNPKAREAQKEEVTGILLGREDCGLTDALGYGFQGETAWI